LWKNVHCIQKPMATWKKVVFFCISALIVFFFVCSYVHVFSY
jgi:hypothetical protein